MKLLLYSQDCYRPEHISLCAQLLNKRNKSVYLSYHIMCASAGSVTLRTMTAKGVKARLLASKSIFDFGQKIVVHSNESKPPYSIEVELTNNDAGPLSFEFGPPSTEAMAGGRGVFTVEPKSATLPKVRPEASHKN